MSAESPTPSPPRWKRRAAQGVIAVLALVCIAACERNPASTFLVPTGVRPAPGSGTAAVIGRVVYDPVQSPDLDQPPYPPTVVELEQAGVVIARDTLARDTRSFRFDRLLPGTYTVVVEARLYQRASAPPIRVVDQERDVGDVLTPLGSLTASVISVVGDYNEFTDTDSCWLFAERPGLWFGPNVETVFDNDGNELLPDTAVTLPAGDRTLRLVLNGLTDDPSYAPVSAAPLEPPVTAIPMRIAEGAQRDFVVTVPTPGRYRFLLDERRMTLTIEHLPEAGSRPIRRLSP